MKSTSEEQPLSALRHRSCPLLAQSGHLFCAAECPLSGVKWT